MEDGALAIARRFMDTYAVGDADGFLDCLTADWAMHEAGGGTSSAADLAEITRLHKVGFPQKQIEYLQELLAGDRVAQYVIFTATHSGPYLDLEATASRSASRIKTAIPLASNASDKR